MNRITRRDLYNQVAGLTRMTGKQFGLETWSPGDGWTRYRLYVKSTENTHRDVSYYMPLHEMYAYLRGMLDIKDALAEANNRPDGPFYNPINQAIPAD